MANLGYSNIVAYFRSLAEKHVDLSDFFRADTTEIMAAMRPGVNYPVLMLEDPELDLSDNLGQNKTEHFDLGFAVLIPCEVQNWDEIEEKRAQTMDVIMELERRVLADSENPEHWLYNRYDANETRFHPIGPIFTDNCYGYRCEMMLRNTDVKRTPTNAKWSDLDG